MINALIGAGKVELLAGEPVVVDTPSESGKGQKIHRCPKCQVTVWSVYSGAGPKFRFVRVGTLANPDACPPEIHIFTESKQPCVMLPESMPAVPQYYRRSEYWPEDGLKRREVVLAED